MNKCLNVSPRRLGISEIWHYELFALEVLVIVLPLQLIFLPSPLGEMHLHKKSVHLCQDLHVWKKCHCSCRQVLFHHLPQSSDCEEQFRNKFNSSSGSLLMSGSLPVFPSFPPPPFPSHITDSLPEGWKSYIKHRQGKSNLWLRGVEA